MHTVGILSALALVGSTLAAPRPANVIVTVQKTVVVTEGAPAPTPEVEVKANNYGQNQGPPRGYGGGRRPNRPPPGNTVIVTQTYGGNQPGPTSPPSPPPQQPKPEEPKPQEPKPEEPKPAPAPAPAPAPSPAPAPAPSTGGDGDYISIVNKYRKQMGLAEVEKSQQLEDNARKTCADGHGKMVHQLLKGTGGQTLAPGKEGDFEKVFVGGWLCEVPSTPGLGQELCDKWKSGWDYQGQTGHNKILVGDYKAIGCALAEGIWGCDVSMEKTGGKSYS